MRERYVELSFPFLLLTDEGEWKVKDEPSSSTDCIQAMLNWWWVKRWLSLSAGETLFLKSENGSLGILTYISSQNEDSFLGLAFPHLPNQGQPPAFCFCGADWGREESGFTSKLSDCVSCGAVELFPSKLHTFQGSTKGCHLLTSHVQPKVKEFCFYGTAPKFQPGIGFISVSVVTLCPAELSGPDQPQLGLSHSALLLTSLLQGYSKVESVTSITVLPPASQSLGCSPPSSSVQHSF